MPNSVNTPHMPSGVPVSSGSAATLGPINSHAASQQPCDSVQSQSLGAAKSVRGHRCEIENDKRPTEDKAGPSTVPPKDRMGAHESSCEACSLAAHYALYSIIISTVTYRAPSRNCIRGTAHHQRVQPMAGMPVDSFTRQNCRWSSRSPPCQWCSWS